VLVLTALDNGQLAPRHWLGQIIRELLAPIKGLSR
jgi:hypothetical protein